MMERKRVCEICGHDGFPHGLEPGRPIVSISATIYRNAEEGRQLAATERTVVCERCLTDATIWAGHHSQLALSRLILNRIASRYKAITRAGDSGAKE